MTPANQKKSKKQTVAKLKVKTKDNPRTSRATPVEDEANRRQTQIHMFLESSNNLMQMKVLFIL